MVRKSFATQSCLFSDVNDELINAVHSIPPTLHALRVFYYYTSFFTGCEALFALTPDLRLISYRIEALPNLYNSCVNFLPQSPQLPNTSPFPSPSHLQFCKVVVLIIKKRQNNNICLKVIIFCKKIYNEM